MYMILITMYERDKRMFLSEVKLNHDYRVIGLHVDGLIKERLLSLGFTKGSKIKAIRHGPKNNLTTYLIKGTMLALRYEESSQIEVEVWD